MTEESFLDSSPTLATLGQSQVSYEVERHIQLTCGLVEIGRFRWLSPVQVEIHSDSELISFNLALSPRPTDASIAYLGECERVERLERLMLLNPGATYRLRHETPGNVRALFCALDKNELQKLLSRPIDFDSENWQARVRTRLLEIELLLNRIYEEICEENLGQEQALEYYARTLCIELARCLQSAGDDTAVRKGGLAPWRYRLLRERIHADAPAPRLAELAQVCGMTVRQLGRAFKEETGQTLGSYVARVTTERAVALLTHTDRPVSQVAAELGFSSPTSFAYAFRRSVGLLPTELRRRAAA